MQLSEALEQIEGMMDLVNALLLEKQPDATEQAVRQLRDGMQALAGLAQRFGADQWNAQNLQRMQQISERLVQIRAHIVKMSAMTTQQVAALMPEQAISQTYGAAKQPGAAASVARMYHFSG